MGIVALAFMVLVLAVTIVLLVFGTMVLVEEFGKPTWMALQWRLHVGKGTKATQVFLAMAGAECHDYSLYTRRTPVSTTYCIRTDNQHKICYVGKHTETPWRWKAELWRRYYQRDEMFEHMEKKATWQKVIHEDLHAGRGHNAAVEESAN